MNFEEIKKRIKLTLSSPDPSAENWADLMAYLQMLKPEVTKEARAREIIAKKKFRELRKEEKSRVDTEDVWKTTEEYLKFQEAEDRLEEIIDWQKVCSRQASTRYHY
jgi:hypothetical protein